ncbi:MAG: stage IV sporulation protein A [Clostridia bacterium]
MENFSIYQDIKERTGGDIYIGVVGPVRCGKSTFITNFMQKLVMPNIKNKHQRDRTNLELPQSAEGLTIMTTQPKFVPDKAVKITVGGNVDMKVRMIDSVGYLISGALGHTENDKPRLVKTPWTENEIPFEDAAEIGTKKIMEDHSTVGIVITTDGTINDIPRSAFVETEHRVIADMQSTGKPFVVVVNSANPRGEAAQNIAKGLSRKFGVSTLAMDVSKLEEPDVEEIFENLLHEFPLKSIKISMPEYLQALPYENDIIESIIAEVKRFAGDLSKIGQVDTKAQLFANHPDFDAVGVDKISLGEGNAEIKLQPKSHLFYKVLSTQCGEVIADDFALVSFIKNLAHAKREYERLEEALMQVEQTGYGVVNPSPEQLSLNDPEIVRQGKHFGVKLKASAPSLHIMKVDVETEINPIVGTEAQSQEMVKFLSSEFENNPEGMWQTNMFGKSLYSMVSDGIRSKIVMMPPEAQMKMRKTLTRIVNEGKGGVICILL